MEGAKRALILAGGGMRLAYQAGVLIALEENSVSFDHVDGTSGGIFNAGMLASGLDGDQIAARWRALDIKKFMSLQPLKKYFKPLNMMGYADANGIRNKIFPGLGIDIHKINVFDRGEVTFNVCNFSNKSIEAIPHHRAKEDHLIAGVSLPIVMPGLQIDGDWYSDAVWIKDANLIEAVQRGATELWLVWAIGNTPTYLPGALNQYVHMIEMSANGGLLEEYARIALINEARTGVSKSMKQQKPVKLFVIKPKFPLPLDPDLFFGKIDARSLINMGYADAKNTLAAMPENGIPMDAAATKMTEPVTRFNLRNEFHGTLNSAQEQFSVSFYSYLVYATAPDDIHHFSSIYIKAFGKEIPCFNHRLKREKSRENSTYESEWHFIHEQEIYSLCAKFNVHTALDLMLGLEFKKIGMAIIKEGKTLMEGTLYQNTQKRLRSRLSYHVRKPDGKGGSLRLNYDMATKLIDYAI
ncbi:MAG: patatin-like phospholipase family protein [Cyclobacteriaceae bacterium]|nr:patatin-like phospholipase family protein [Cyclobacteriaceae bacterium]